jgi:hypothetical protein
MAQAPRPGLPPDPNAGKNIHGQPNVPASRVQTTIPGQPPQANMAFDDSEPEGLSDNTRAEMNAGKANLAQYSKRNDAEHEAGRRANQVRNPQGNNEQE